MDFKTVTKKLLAAFTEENVAYALIGGYAVGLWGVPRGTVDMDFLIRRDDLEKVHRIMETLGYETVHASENVTQYVSPLALFGEIDFLHAFRGASLRMLSRAVEKPIFLNGLTIRVLLPEDLIGLKTQAIANNADRESLDRYDIESLMRIHAASMDWDLIEEYFELFEMSDVFCELERKYHAH